MAKKAKPPRETPDGLRFIHQDAVILNADGCVMSLSARMVNPDKTPPPFLIVRPDELSVDAVKSLLESPFQRNMVNGINSYFTEQLIHKEQNQPALNPMREIMGEEGWAAHILRFPEDARPLLGQHKNSMSSVAGQFAKPMLLEADATKTPQQRQNIVASYYSHICDKLPVESMIENAKKLPKDAAKKPYTRSKDEERFIKLFEQLPEDIKAIIQHIGVKIIFNDTPLKSATIAGGSNFHLKEITINSEAIKKPKGAQAHPDSPLALVMEESVHYVDAAMQFTKDPKWKAAVEKEDYNTLNQLNAVTQGIIKKFDDGTSKRGLTYRAGSQPVEFLVDLYIVHHLLEHEAAHSPKGSAQDKLDNLPRQFPHAWPLYKGFLEKVESISADIKQGKQMDMPAPVVTQEPLTSTRATPDPVADATTIEQCGHASGKSGQGLG